MLEKNKKHAQNWTPTWSGDDDLSIYGVTNVNETYVVNLKQHTCACMKWDLSGILCSHVITYLWKTMRKPKEYAYDYYKYLSFMSCFKM